MRQLPPLILRDKYWRSIDVEITRILTALIYRPLLDVIGPRLELQNSGRALVDAVRDGAIWWDAGLFKGQFDSRITKELRVIGATYNAPSRTWSLARDLLPADIRMAQANADARYDALRRGLLSTLDDMQIESINQMSDIPDRYIEAITWMNEDFIKTVRAITIPPKLTDEQRNIIAAEWGQNLDKYVKDWSTDRILRLREQVQANAFDGRRANELVQMIRQDYGVSWRKAEFLARQETSLLMSKFRETRYRDIGANRYRWSSSHDERVRHDHRELNGKIFSWDMPPVTNRETGARNNPGEDFGCRCVAIALVD